MLCFIIPKSHYDLLIERKLKVEPKHICIGSIKSLSEAYTIADTLPCLTEVHVYGKINKCCYIACNP